MKSDTLPRLTIIVLAAGSSSRLGRSKALARVRGSTLMQRTLAVLAPFAAGQEIIAIVPPKSRRYGIGMRAGAVSFVPNSHWASGLSSSVRRGVGAVGRCAAVLLLPVDLAELGHRDVARLIARWRGTRRHIVARRVDGRAGTPLILPRSLFWTALGATGDQGLRDVVRHLPSERVVLLDMPSAALDVDTPHDLARARRRFRTPPL